jgi:hypothetical protein
MWAGNPLQYTILYWASDPLQCDHLGGNPLQYTILYWAGDPLQCDHLGR